MEETLAAIALMAGVFSRGDHRQAALAYFYGITFSFALIVIPTPAVFKEIGYSYWYLAWAAYEAVIILECKLLSGAPGATVVKYLSMFALCLHLITGFLYVKQPHFTFFYHYHKSLSQALETLQVCALFIFTPLVRHLIERIIPERARSKFKWLRMETA